jgi:hypothetical protein
MKIHFQSGSSLLGISDLPLFMLHSRLNNTIIQSTTCNDKPNIYEKQMYFKNSQTNINV